MEGGIGVRNNGINRSEREIEREGEYGGRGERDSMGLKCIIY